MSVTLGLNFNHADSSACLFIDNSLKFAVEEERINRIKHWAGVPLLSINECLKYAKIKIEDIDTITINSNPFSNLKKKF